MDDQEKVQVKLDRMNIIVRGKNRVFCHHADFYFTKIQLGFVKKFNLFFLLAASQIVVDEQNCGKTFIASVTGGKSRKSLRTAGLKEQTK